MKKKYQTAEQESLKSVIKAEKEGTKKKTQADFKKKERPNPTPWWKR